MRRIVKTIALVAAVLLLLAACAPGPNSMIGAKDGEGKTAGFWRGLWHGIIAPFSFLISLFNHNVNIYETRNNGGWYNFGYILGLSVIFGGSGRGAGGVRAHRRRND